MGCIGKSVATTVDWDPFFCLTGTRAQINRMPLPLAPEIGQLVQVRQRQFIVTDVVGSSLPDRPIKTTSNGAQWGAVPRPGGRSLGD